MLVSQSVSACCSVSGGLSVSTTVVTTSDAAVWCACVCDGVVVVVVLNAALVLVAWVFVGPHQTCNLKCFCKEAYLWSF